jgi:hypothetical protein
LEGFLGEVERLENCLQQVNFLVFDWEMRVVGIRCNLEKFYGTYDGFEPSSYGGIVSAAAERRCQGHLQADWKR